MFQALVQGNKLYIIKRDANGLTLKEGVVENVLPPSQYPMYQPYKQDVNLTINVKVGEESMAFNNVPSSLSVVNYSKDNVTICDNKESVQAEIETAMQTSRYAIADDTISYHKAVLASGDEIIKRLNPTYKKDKERDEAISTLKSDMAGVKSDLHDIAAMIKSLSGRETSK